jgi:hypothetical protein
MCHLCTGRQADYVPDPWTEERKTLVLAQLRAAARVSQPATDPVILALPTTTATLEAWSTMR